MIKLPFYGEEQDIFYEKLDNGLEVYIVPNKNERKYLYDGARKITVENISPYLRNEPTTFVESRTNHISPMAKKMSIGNRPADGGHLILTEDDYKKFIISEPNSLKYIKQFVGGDEYINGKKRYCLWLVDCEPNELRNMPMVLKRIELCKEDRLKGAPDRQKLAGRPHLFREIKNPNVYLLFAVLILFICSFTELNSPLLSIYPP